MVLWATRKMPKRQLFLLLVLNFAFAPVTPETFAQATTQLSPISKPSRDTVLAIPSQRTKVPLPPKKIGCHHLKSGRWEEVPCDSGKENRSNLRPQQLFNPGMSTQSIYSNQRTIEGRRGRTTTTPGFVWGSVSVGFLLDPYQATESGPTPNDFSIQTNTNYFYCSSSSSCTEGHQAWVQFVYESVAKTFCIWQMDITLAMANGWYNGVIDKTCYPYEIPVRHPLTGQGAAIPGSGEVIGYVNKSPDVTTICAFLYADWTASAFEDSWYHVCAPSDYVQLKDNWTNISGTIYGAGGGAKAVFTKTQMKTVVRAYTCIASDPNNETITPQSCPPSRDRYFDPLVLNASAGLTDPSQGTRETNNLTDGPVDLQCNDYDCYISYTSTSPN